MNWKPMLGRDGLYAVAREAMQKEEIPQLADFFDEIFVIAVYRLGIASETGVVWRGKAAFSTQGALAERLLYRCDPDDATEAIAWAANLIGGSRPEELN